MTTKTSLELLLKTALLAFHLLMFNSLASRLAGVSGAHAGGIAGLSLTTVIGAVSSTIVLSYVVIRSRWSGWRLAVVMFIVFFGIITLLPQIESAVYPKHLVNVPAEMVPKLFAQGAILAAMFAPMLVLFWRKKKGPDTSHEPNRRLIMPVKEWGWKLLLVAVIYIGFYAVFSAFVFLPLAGEAIREYHAGLETPWWVIPFQALKGLLWTALALPVIRMMKGAWWEAGLAVSLLFSVLMGSPLLTPTEVMPDNIRLAHLVDVTSVNFLFGWTVVWLFHRRHTRSCGTSLKTAV